jgi:cytochrome c biogenesis protein
MRNPATGQVQFYRTDNDEFINPTVELEVFRGKTSVFRTYVMKTEPGEPYMPEDYVISYNAFWGARYTGLQVAKDPGVWVVYAGFILLCIGPLIAFFGSHRKLWVRVQDRKGQAVILVAGSANRNRLGFERRSTELQRKFQVAA